MLPHITKYLTLKNKKNSNKLHSEEFDLIKRLKRLDKKAKT